MAKDRDVTKLVKGIDRVAKKLGKANDRITGALRDVDACEAQLANLGRLAEDIDARTTSRDPSLKTKR